MKYNILIILLSLMIIYGCVKLRFIGAILFNIDPCPKYEITDFASCQPVESEE